MHSSFSFQGLSERGFVEGRDVGIEHHYEQGQPNRLPSLATDLVWRLVAIIVTTGGALRASIVREASAPNRLGLLRHGYCC